MRNQLILVVDDNEAGRYTKCRMLRQAGFQVKEAGSGGEALQIIAAESPDLVCLDVRLPDMDGFEVCRRIKADPLLCTMVLQMSASFVGQDDKVRGLEGGADGYLVSPFESGEFYRHRAIAASHAPSGRRITSFRAAVECDIRCDQRRNLADGRGRTGVAL